MKNKVLIFLMSGLLSIITVGLLKTGISPDFTNNPTPYDGFMCLLFVAGVGRSVFDLVNHLVEKKYLSLEPKDKYFVIFISVLLLPISYWIEAKVQTSTQVDHILSLGIAAFLISIYMKIIRWLLNLHKSE
jgi:hypothetical protein